MLRLFNRSVLNIEKSKLKKGLLVFKVQYSLIFSKLVQMKKEVSIHNPVVEDRFLKIL